MTLASTSSLLILLPAVACLVIAGWQARETTLLAVWGWLVFGMIGVAGTKVEQVFAVAPNSSTAPLRYVAAVLALSPIVALLGAKRPQSRAWQLIVASFVVLLLLPAAEGIWFGSGSVPELHVTRRLLLLGLTGVGVANYLPTRFAPAALCYAGGELLLLAPFVEWLSRWDVADAVDLAASLFTLAIVLASTAASRAFRRKNSGELAGPWLAFRDAYGLAWPLRVAERFNATAAAQGWEARLAWHGLEPAESTLAGDSRHAEMARNLDSLLRRFVSPAWIAHQRGRAGQPSAAERGERGT